MSSLEGRESSWRRALTSWKTLEDMEGPPIYSAPPPKEMPGWDLKALYTSVAVFLIS